MSDHVPAYHEIEDPKRASRDLRDLIRDALLHKETGEAIREVLENGAHYGHKILRWAAAWKKIEVYHGDRLDPYKDIDLYTKQQKMRSVYRERAEIDKRWRLTGNKAKRLTMKSTA